jgi:hypothetical protein
MGFGKAGWVERKAGLWDFWHRWWLVLEPPPAEAPHEAGRLAWHTVEDTASLSVEQREWSRERSVDLADISGLRVCCDAAAHGAGNEIELLSASTPSGAHRFRFADAEELSEWVRKLSELLFSRECRAVGAALGACPHCSSSADRAPSDTGWFPGVGTQCLWQPLGSKRSPQQQRQRPGPALATVLWRGWPVFAKPCKEKEHRQQWLGLSLDRAVENGGDGTVKGVRYYDAPEGCGRMVAASTAQCRPVPPGWVAPDPEPLLEPQQQSELEPVPRHSPELGAGAGGGGGGGGGGAGGGGGGGRAVLPHRERDARPRKRVVRPEGGLPEGVPPPPPPEPSGSTTAAQAASRDRPRGGGEKGGAGSVRRSKGKASRSEGGAAVAARGGRRDHAKQEKPSAAAAAAAAAATGGAAATAQRGSDARLARGQARGGSSSHGGGSGRARSRSRGGGRAGDATRGGKSKGRGRGKGRGARRGGPTRGRGRATAAGGEAGGAGGAGGGRTPPPSEDGD